MALTPDQASQLTPGNFDEVQRIEKDVDSRLLNSFNPTVGRFDYAFLKEKEAKLPLKVIFEIQRRYLMAGWNVSLVRDGEECTGMVLAAPNAPAPKVLEPFTVHRQLMSKEDSVPG